MHIIEKTCSRFIYEIVLIFRARELDGEKVAQDETVRDLLVVFVHNGSFTVNNFRSSPTHVSSVSRTAIDRFSDSANSCNLRQSKYSRRRRGNLKIF